MDSHLLIENIRSLCKKNKVSISRLEADLFLSPGLISRWNKNTPSLDKVADIADYFNVSIDDLIGRSDNLSNTNKLGRFLFRLYQRSMHSETVWAILNPQSMPKELSGITLPKNFIDNLYGCYYTSYQNGFFILTACHTSDGVLKLALYILPDIYSQFEYVCADTSPLIQLYEFLEPRFRKLLNEMKANNLISSYIQENITTESPENEKITLLRNIDEASSY